MKKFYDICKNDGAIGAWICLIVSIGLLVGSFFAPPTGIIDSSCLAGTGELFAFGVLFKLPNLIQSIRDGKSLSVRHNDTEITVSSEKKEN